MRISTVVHGVPFAKVVPGNIIRIFDKDGKLYTGMKVYREHYTAVLFLQSQSSFKMADIGETLAEQDLMLEAPEAVLLCSEFSQSPHGRAPATGDLTIHDDGKTMLLAKMNGCPLYVDMSTGQVLSPDKGRMPYIKVSKWSIVLRGDTTECLVEFPYASECGQEKTSAV